MPSGRPDRTLRLPMSLQTPSRHQDPPLSPEQQVKPRHFELRMALLFAAVFMPNGFYMPYFPLWLRESGFGPDQIGILRALHMFVRVVTGPTISALADRAQDRVPVLMLLALCAAASAAGYFLPPVYALVLGISLVFSFFWGPQSPLADSLALSGVRRYGSEYPKMRVWGSVAFLSANICGGWVINRAGVFAFPWLLVGALLSIFFRCLIAPRLGRPRRPALGAAEVLPRAAPIFRNRYFVLFLLSSALAQASHAQIYTFGTIYWESIGIGATAIGFLWAFSVMAEVAIFTVFRRFFGRIPSSVVLAIGAVVGIARWILFPLVDALGLGLAGFFLVQGMHAFSFSAVFLATQKMLAETVPEERIGAAQGAAYFANNMLLASLTLAAGPLYRAFGPDSFAAMAGVAAVGFMLAIACVKLAPERRRGRQDG
jgi:PPP family 3-phenylpropionic acid transporter